MYKPKSSYRCSCYLWLSTPFRNDRCPKHRWLEHCWRRKGRDTFHSFTAYYSTTTKSLSISFTKKEAVDSGVSTMRTVRSSSAGFTLHSQEGFQHYHCKYTHKCKTLGTPALQMSCDSPYGIVALCGYVAFLLWWRASGICIMICFY